MRAKIIQYNGADGTGTIVAEGRQYRFALTVWRGDSAPAINKTVEIMLEGEDIVAVTAVGEDVLFKEKAAEFGGKLGAMFNKQPASTSAATGAGGSASEEGTASGAGTAGGEVMMQVIVRRYGKMLLGAYVLFVLGTLAFNAISVSIGPGMGKSLFDISGLMSQFGASGGGMVKVLLLLGYASIVLPMLWHDRRAWLALGIPLLAVLWAVFSALHTIGSMGSGMSRGIARGMSDMFSIGFGLYLSLAMAIVLVVFAFKRFSSAA